MKMNLDVLSEVMSYLSPLDAATVSPTCKVMRYVAIPLMLKDVVLKIKTTQKLNKFIFFVVNDLERRPRLLRALTVQAPNESKSPYRRKHGASSSQNSDNLLDDVGLAKILSRAHNLRSITLGQVEDLFSRYPRVAASVEGLTSLRAVKMYSVGKATVSTLCSMQSTPQQLSLNLDQPGGPFPLTSSHSLLSLTSWDAHSIDTRNMLPADPIIVLSNVRALNCSASKVSLEKLGRTFPNIETLCLSDNDYFDVQICWKYLHRLQGGLSDLIILTITSPGALKVHRLDLSEDTPVNLSSTWDVLGEVITACSPSFMWLPIDPEAIPVPRAFIEAGNSLKSLKIILVEHHIMHLHRWYLKLREHLGDLPLIAFCLSVKRDRKPGRGDVEPDMSTHLADAIPSASVVGFEVESDLDSLRMWWSVTNQGQVRMVKEVPESMNEGLEKIVFGADANTDVKSQVETYLASAERDVNNTG